MTVSATELLEKATEITGLRDFGDDWFRGALAAYVSDLGAPHLSDRGRAFLTRLVVKDLARRLEIVDCLKKHPQIEQTPIPPIVYVTGHERAGTTLLHNLLALHRDARFLARWELMRPTPPPGPGSCSSDPRIAEVQASVDALRGSALENMHWVNATEPEECVWGFMDCTGLLGMAVGLIMPRWQEWMSSHDMTPTIVNYRRIIQILTWKRPIHKDGFLVLKSPQMTSYLTCFHEVFPDTNYIYIHRDPYQVLRSFCTLVEVVDGPFLQHRRYLAELESGQQRCLHRMGRYFDNLAAFEASNPGRVFNIQYADLLGSPASEVSRVLSRAGQSRDERLGEKIQDFLRRQKAGERAAPRTEMIDYGYTREQVARFPPIADYLRRYAVPIEARRQTGV